MLPSSSWKERYVTTVSIIYGHILAPYFTHKLHCLNEKRYSMLLATTTYKLQIIQCGGQLQDVRDFWKEAMKIEEELTATNQMH